MQDLGGLGAREGTRVVHTWTPPSVFPSLVPWVALLALLALKPNRAGGAWWIWGAVFGGIGFQALLRTCVTFLPSQPLEALAEALQALNLGMAAVWLLSGYLSWRHGFLTYLGTLGILAGFSGGAYLLGQSWGGGGEAVISGTVVALGAFVIASALGLAGWLSRNHYRPVVLSVLCGLAVAVVSLLVLAPFAVFAVVTSPGSFPVLEFLQGVGLLTAMNLGLLLVYLVLAFASDFYRQRLKGFLHLGTHERPPVIAPPLGVELAGAK